MIRDFKCYCRAYIEYVMDMIINSFHLKRHTYITVIHEHNVKGTQYDKYNTCIAQDYNALIVIISIQ